MDSKSSIFINRRLLLCLGIACLLATLPACNSSSSGSGGVAVNGLVQAPSGQLASTQTTLMQWFAALSPIATALAIDVVGWSEVPNATLRVFNIDNDGEPIGSVIATTTTDANGAFTLNLPAGTTLASNLIVQASSDPTITGPVPIGTPNTLSAPVVAETVDINPVTEAAARALVDRAEPLANFSAAEVAVIIAALETQVAESGLPPYDNLAAAVDGVVSLFADEITAALDDASEPPPATPGNLTGRWISSYNCETNTDDGFSGTDIIDITQTGNNLSFTAANDEGPGTTPVFNMNGTGTLSGNVVTWSLIGVGFTESGTWEVTNAETMLKQSTYVNDEGGGSGTCSGSIHRES